MIKFVVAYFVLVALLLLFLSLDASKGLRLSSNFFTDLKNYPIVLYFFIFFLVAALVITHLSLTADSSLPILQTLLTALFFYLALNCFELGHGPDWGALNFVSQGELARQRDWLVKWTM